MQPARYRRGPTRGSEALVRACAVYTQPVYSVPLCVWKSLALAVQCETTHGVYEFRREFCFHSHCEDVVREGKRIEQTTCRM